MRFVVNMPTMSTSRGDPIVLGLIATDADPLAGYIMARQWGSQDVNGAR